MTIKFHKFVNKGSIIIFHELICILFCHSYKRMLLWTHKKNIQ